MSNQWVNMDNKILKLFKPIRKALVLSAVFTASLSSTVRYFPHEKP